MVAGAVGFHLALKIIFLFTWIDVFAAFLKGLGSTNEKIDTRGTIRQKNWLNSNQQWV